MLEYDYTPPPSPPHHRRHERTFGGVLLIQITHKISEAGEPAKVPASTAVKQLELRRLVYDGRMFCEKNDNKFRRDGSLAFSTINKSPPGVGETEKAMPRFVSGVLVKLVELIVLFQLTKLRQLVRFSLPDVLPTPKYMPASVVSSSGECVQQ